LPYKSDTTSSPSNATLDTWFGDQNGCAEIQYDSTGDSEDANYRMWFRANDI
jgi:hypothetical protein